MGLIAGALLAGTVWLTLWRIGRLPRAALQLAGAALLFGLGGYALQGRVGLVGSPAGERPAAALPPAMPLDLAEAFYGRFNAAFPWLVLANGYCRRGESGEAVAVLRSAIKAYPRSAELWTALGNALIIHGGGRMSASADLAFARSRAVAPQHPGPPFFYGLALLREGAPDRTLPLWREAVARGRPNASWQPELKRRIALIEALIAAAPVPGRPTVAP